MPQVHTYLGQPDTLVLPLLSVERQTDVDRLLAELADLDELLAAALRDSMAVKVGELTVDYARHITQLRQEGSGKLRLLSILSGVPLLFDKYTGRSVTSGGNSQYSLRRFV